VLVNARTFAAGASNVAEIGQRPAGTTHTVRSSEDRLCHLRQGLGTLPN
jgi:hypothetical protein